MLQAKVKRIVMTVCRALKQKKTNKRKLNVLPIFAVKNLRDKLPNGKLKKKQSSQVVKMKRCD